MLPSNPIKPLRAGTPKPLSALHPLGSSPRPGITISRPSSRRLHRKQAAEYLGVSLSWLDKSRLTGLGPVFIAISSRVVYDSADLDQFLQRNRRTSTSE